VLSHFLRMALTSATSVVHIPTRTPQPNFGNLLIIDDVLYPKDQEPYTPFNLHVRLALFILSQIIPTVASILLIFSRKGWWRRKFYWTMNRMMVLWLISIQIFGAVVYFQNGATTRLLFISAIIHLQIEYMVMALLLKRSGLEALVVAYVVGTILFGIPIFVPDFSIVYMLTVVSGATDFALPLLLLYGRQWLFAIAALAHAVQVVAVFVIVIKDFGLFWWNFLTFWGTWIQSGALVAAILRIWLANQKQPIHLPPGDDASDTDRIPGGEAPDNPLAHVEVSKMAAIIIFGLSFGVSTLSSFLFVFVIARN